MNFRHQKDLLGIKNIPIGFNLLYLTNDWDEILDFFIFIIKEQSVIILEYNQ